LPPNFEVEVLNFACFWPLKFFWGVPLEILDWHYKIGPITDHRAKFHAGRPTHLGDLASGKKIKLEIWAKPNVSPPGALSATGKNSGGGKISPASKSRGPNSNALAYAERALST